MKKKKEIFWMNLYFIVITGVYICWRAIVFMKRL